MLWGVVQFPGSCDERDALHACRLSGEARLIWHEERDLGGVDAVVIPGGFSYGDYLRAGAIARFSPAMEAVAELAADGRPGLGVRNEAGNVLGLMPHPEHAVDAMTGSTDGLRIFESVAAVAA